MYSPPYRGSVTLIRVDKTVRASQSRGTGLCSRQQAPQLWEFTSIRTLLADLVVKVYYAYASAIETCNSERLYS